MGIKAVEGDVDLYPGQLVEKSYASSSSQAQGIVNGVCIDINLRIRIGWMLV